MPESFAQSQVTRLETLLVEAVGLKEITVGNTKTTYDDLTRHYQYWCSRVAREQGTAHRLVRLDLSGTETSVSE